jgi:hypothetical protein
LLNKSFQIVTEDNILSGIKSRINGVLKNLPEFQTNFLYFWAFKRVMRKLIPGNLAFVISGLILSLLSCSLGSCFEETESYLKVSFYSNTTKKLVAPDSLTIYGLNMETTKLYNKATKIQPALIPLNSSASECTYVIRINGITDTIQFRYNSYPHLVSKECGYTFYHQLDTEPIPTYHGIRYIFTSNSTITTLNVENIRIFY